MQEPSTVIQTFLKLLGYILVSRQDSQVLLIVKVLFLEESMVALSAPKYKTRKR